jgi:hypothetical protein
MTQGAVLCNTDIFIQEGEVTIFSLHSEEDVAVYAVKNVQEAAHILFYGARS